MFEATEWIDIFLGHWAKYLYLLLTFSVMTSVSSFLILIGFAIIAGSAWSINLPLNFTGVAQCNSLDSLTNYLFCRHAYWLCLFLFLFACIVVPLSSLLVTFASALSRGLLPACWNLSMTNATKPLV